MKNAIVETHNATVQIAHVAILVLEKVVTADAAVANRKKEEAMLLPF